MDFIVRTQAEVRQGLQKVLLMVHAPGLPTRAPGALHMRAGAQPPPGTQRAACALQTAHAVRLQKLHV